MSEKNGKKPTTVGLPLDMIEEIKAEAVRVGVPWTSMIAVLIRQALDDRRTKAA